MKKIIAFLLSLILLVTFCGCSGNPDDSSSVEIEIIYEDETVEDGTSNSADKNGSDNTTSGSSQQSGSSSDGASSTGTGTDYQPYTPQPTVIDYETAVEVDLCDNIVRAYLDASTPQTQFALLNEHSGKLHDSQAAKLSWSVNGSKEYTVHISENKDFSNSITFKTDKNNLNPGMLIPGRTYYWKVIGQKSSDAIAGGKIVTKNTPVRFINVEGVGNFRDMGGWVTESGKTVAYGKLYRGRQLDGITSSGKKVFEKLAIKTEIDIRMEKNSPSQIGGLGLNYKYFDTPDTMFMYNRIFNTQNKEKVTENYKAIFALLADESNYPFYIHCTAGADRTGTLAFLINGYLGVSYEDLTRDFELTSFSPSGSRWRGSGAGGTFGSNDFQMAGDKSYVAWGLLHKEMMGKFGTGDGKLSSAIENYLVNYVGVPAAHLESMKSIMLG